MRNQITRKTHIDDVLGKLQKNSTPIAAAAADAAAATDATTARRGFIFIKNNDSEAQYIKFANRLLEIIKTHAH